METATFAAGCFWGVEEAFLKLPGVADTEVGYAGGFVKNPTYEEVCDGKTGHSETVRITYDRQKISYRELVEALLNMRNSTIETKTQYKSIIFVNNLEERQIAEAVREEYKEKVGKKIFTEIKQMAPFYRAEEYHQKYLRKQRASL